MRTLNYTHISSLDVFINPHHPQLIAANSEKDLVLVMDAVGHYYVKVITWCCNYLHPFEASR